MFITAGASPIQAHVLATKEGIDESGERISGSHMEGNITATTNLESNADWGGAIRESLLKILDEEGKIDGDVIGEGVKDDSQSALVPKSANLYSKGRKESPPLRGSANFERLKKQAAEIRSTQGQSGKGMNASTKRLGIKKVCKDHQAKLVCLLETKVKVDNCGAIFDNFIPDWKYVHNGEIDNTIRIWLGWDPSCFNVEEIQKTKQFIHAKVSIMGTTGSFLCTVVYALNTVAGRKDLWEDVGSLASAIATPWAVLGDFNVIRNHNEKIGGDPVRFEAIDDFNTFIEDSWLIDLKWKGEAMTWNNRQSGDARICCFLKLGLVELGLMIWFGRAGNSLLACVLNPILRFAARLRNIKKELKKWNKECIGDVFVAVKVAQAELYQTQCNLRDHPDDPNLVLLETQAKVKLWEALVIEEMFLKEKSRVKHIQLGDGNNSFFHKSMICRQNRKHILEIKGEGGEIVKDPSQIKDEAVSFYKKLFGSDSVD
ncbi:uncharacterized protein LOC122647758, partial [Telopea speciosissima]|uniref:uncharacterized protein LOC122647758 n=1 Tax=Telopea speciosissima TaxID=54955 RepID=UPI001CC755E3